MQKSKNGLRRQVNIQLGSIPEIQIFSKCDYQTTHQKLEEHIHKDSFEVVYFYNGCQAYWVEGQVYQCQSGELFFTKPNEVHSSGESFEQKSGLFYFIFHLTENTEHFFGFSKEDLTVLKQTLFQTTNRKWKASTKLKQLMNQVVFIYEKKDVFYETRIRGLYIEVFYEIIKLMKSQEQLSDQHAVSKSIAYMQEHILDQITVEQLAEIEHLSVAQFTVLFKNATGFSPHDYLVRERIEVAKDMLQYTELPITKVAIELSFSSSQYFATVFKRYVGMSASEFRKK